MAILACFPRDTLQRYLAGWIDQPEAAVIEQHLRSCDACEQTVIDLESHPVTLLEPIRRTPAEAGKPDAMDALLRRAMSSAEALMTPDRPRDQGESSPAEGRVGPYELLNRLGRGGMGAVYLARHTQLGKRVAIKLLPARWAEQVEAIARFRREIQAVGKLNHAAIVSATDAGEQDGWYYLVMEHIEGVDLSHLARASGPLNIADACEVARQAALGLSYAHAEGIVHRDIKPSNVMLDHRGQVKVLDFGLALLSPWEEASAEITTVGQLMGTLDYMAPEQAERPSAVDYRVDLYSLGAMLFRLVTGRAPLAAAPHLSPLDKLRLLAEHHPPRLDTLRPDAPPELVELVASLLQRRPESRPASAAHVAEQLSPLCRGADLVELAARAKAKLQDAVIEQHGAWPGTQMPQALGVSRMRAGWLQNWLRRLAWSGLAAGGLLAAVLIILETRKGQLVIESEVAGVHVKLLSDGKQVDGLQLQTGTTTTRLAADQYEIVVDSPSDVVVVENNEFMLRRGETVVARIRRRAASHPLSPAQAATAVEPIYAGKALDDWLEQLRRDRSPAAIKDSLLALEALLQPETSPRITAELRGVLPTMDPQAFPESLALLRKANPGRAYYELVARLLTGASPDWGSRVLTHVTTFDVNASSAADLEPLLRWIETAFDDENQGAAPSPLLGASARLVYELLYSHKQRQFEARLLPRLERSRSLGPEFWLASPPIPDWSADMRRIVFDRATKALQAGDTSPQLVAQAAMILTDMLPDSDANSRGDVSMLSDAVQSRLTAMAREPARWQSITEVRISFHKLVDPESDTPRGRIRCSEGLELLDLATALKSQSDRQFDLASLVDATADAYRKVKATGLGVVSATPLAMALLRDRSSNRSWPGPPPDLVIGYFICARAAEVGELPLPALDAAGKPDAPDSPPSGAERTR